MDSKRRLCIKAFRFNLFRENCYLLWDEAGDCVIIDPGCYGVAETRMLKDSIASHGLKPRAIWLTHGHFDHVFGVAELSREYSIPVLMSPEDKVIVQKDPEFAGPFGLEGPDNGFETVDIQDGQILRFAQDDRGAQDDITFRVIATPGHTPGCVCFYSEAQKLIFTGDTLFAGAIGRTDVFGGDYDKEIVSIMDRLMELPGDVDVLPGHGHPTTIAEERNTNPFLQPWGQEDDFV